MTFREAVRALICEKFGHKFRRRTYPDGKVVDNYGLVTEVGQWCWRCRRYIR